jgi:glyoxylase-like metal-dependent hydrolase (beta-lactamase superfamily II)
MYGLPWDQPEATPQLLAEGEVVTCGSRKFNVMHVPGHAPGHVAFVGEGIALSGDLLFAGSIGRTDLPLSDPYAMDISLERFAALPVDTIVYPGHGPGTTIGRELETNPFLSGRARSLKR